MKPEYNTLNINQQKAVFTNKKKVLVMSGAGAGKTKVLTNRICYLLEHGVLESQIVENDHEPIISKELFDKVAALRKSNMCQNKKKITVQGITERLDKFLYCPVCGHSFVFNRYRNTLAYRDKKCGMSINANVVHKALYERCLDILSRVKENPEDFKKLVLQKQMSKTYQEFLKEVTLEKQEAEVSLEKLFEEYALGNITKEDYDIQAQILNDELETVELKQNDLMKEK